MKISIFDTYDELSKKAAEDLIDLMQCRKDPLLCIASGDSPAGLYQNIADKSDKKELDISGWSFIGLDEWVGMNGNNEGSCRYHLDQQFFRPLKITDDKIFFFDGQEKDLEKECNDAESFIAQHSGIDIAVLGLGLNGHIGMNEPGTPVSSLSHVAKLEPITQQTGQKYFKENQELNEGITLGIGTLLRAKHIILLANGSKKAEIIQKLMEGTITEQIPATLLHRHPDVRIYLDSEAAQLLSQNNSEVF
jgi:glucosamine-6-phosphate isomerase